VVGVGVGSGGRTQTSPDDVNATISVWLALTLAKVYAAADPIDEPSIQISSTTQLVPGTITKVGLSPAATTTVLFVTLTELRVTVPLPLTVTVILYVEPSALTGIAAIDKTKMTTASNANNLTNRLFWVIVTGII